MAGSSASQSLSVLSRSDGAKKIGVKFSGVDANLDEYLNAIPDVLSVSELVNISADSAEFLRSAKKSVKTLGYDSLGDGGGAQYSFYLLSEYRVVIGNGAWLPDGFGNFYLSADNNYVIVNSGIDSELIDVRQYGVIDNYDGGAGKNNKAAIDYLYSIAPVKLHFKKSKGGTGKYLYSGLNTMTDAAGVEVVVDAGVSFHLTSATNSPLWLKNLIVNREVVSYREVAGNSYPTMMGPNAYEKPSEQSRMAGAYIGGVYQSVAIDLAESKGFSLSSWPNGDLVEAVPSSVTEYDVNWGVVPSSNFYFSVVPVSVGDNLTAHVSSGVERGCVLVETDNGWVVVNSLFGSGRMQVTERTGLGNSVQYDFYDDIFDQVEYNFNRCALGFVIFGTRSFGLTLNGVMIKRIDTIDKIVSVGWGAGFETGGASLTVSRASYFKNKKTVGIKPLKIVGVGDSTSDSKLAPSQFQYMKKYLAGVCGCQVSELKNIAVAGQTSVQQLGILQATDIANFDYCCIQIGVNDIQAGVPSLTYSNNVKSMINYCLGNNVVPIVGLPTGFYSKADAQAFGQDGQQTSNSDKVGQYRDVLIRELAGVEGVFINTGSSEDMGAILASSIAGDVDAVLCDNIHPTAFGQMLMGYSFAKSIVGHCVGADKKGGMVRMPSRWFAGDLGSTARPFYYADGDVFGLSWFLSLDGEVVADGDVIATLPVRYRPAKPFYSSAVCATATSHVPTAAPAALLHFSDSGEVRAYGVDAAAIYLGVDCEYRL